MENSEWVVTVTDKLITELAQSFQMGPIYKGGLRSLNEQLVEQVAGLKIEIFANEHPPRHFRVKYAGETARAVAMFADHLNIRNPNDGQFRAA
jgi:hypothetical protein